ncbi:unnamed protein product [Oppiella nova]|uniref:Uncharacterized protein n=1 Tax=Oppiella nova TaxID=334625 RepID=A0A7R9QVZ7_9ACAR|nr:unnamed protein product [Oppiella nova]CAG2177608.1 unnamed protein product [Oppiella nova]
MTIFMDNNSIATINISNSNLIMNISGSGMMTGPADVGPDDDYYTYYDFIGKCLYDFREGYLPIHGWISVFVCLFGIIANILNIIVLTRKEMISPTNAILTGLAGQ